MTATKLLTLLLTAMLVTAGAGTAMAANETTTATATEPTDTPADEDADDTEEDDSDDAGDSDDSESSLNLSVDATLENDTVDLTVTDDGTGIENVSVAANGDAVGATDASGSLAFETNATEELELALAGENWSAEYVYAVENGTLVLQDSEVETPESDDDERKGPDENASATAHAVFETIQDWLESDRDSNLGRLVSDALGVGNGNAGQADEHRPDHAGNSNEKPGNADAAGDRPDHAGPGSAGERDEKPGNDNAGKQNPGKQNGHGAGNPHADDGADENDEDDGENDDEDDENSDD